MNKFLNELRRTPIVQAACDRLGISRNTYYRWKNEDPLFKKDAETALSEGEELVNDIAVSNVLQGISNKDKGYTMYWLSRIHPKFSKRYTERMLQRPEIEFDMEATMAMRRRWFGETANPPGGPDLSDPKTKPANKTPNKE